MDRGVAEGLIAELNKRISVQKDKKDDLIEILEDTPTFKRGFHLQGSSQTSFGVTIHHNEFPVITGRTRYFSLSLRRVLSNRIAGLIYLGDNERIAQRSFKIPRIGYSTTEKVSRIKDNPELLRMMGQSGAPFSLLGRIRIHDYDNPEERLFIVSRPLLVISGVSNLEEVERWELENAHYRKEVGLFLRHQKKISMEDYLKAATL